MQKDASGGRVAAAAAALANSTGSGGNGNSQGEDHADSSRNRFLEAVAIEVRKRQEMAKTRAGAAVAASNSSANELVEQSYMTPMRHPQQHPQHHQQQQQRSPWEHHQQQQQQQQQQFMQSTQHIHDNSQQPYTPHQAQTTYHPNAASLAASTTPLNTPHAYQPASFRDERQQHQQPQHKQQQHQQQHQQQQPRFGLESPIGLQQPTHLSASGDTQGPAYNHPTEQLRAMLAARSGSQSPTEGTTDKTAGAMMRIMSAGEEDQSPRSQRMVSSGSSPGQMMRSSRPRQSSPNSHHAIAATARLQAMASSHRHAHSLGQMAQVLSRHSPASVVPSNVGQQQQQPRSMPRQSSGRSASPNDSSSFQSQHSRAVSSQSSVLSSFSGRHTGDSSFSSMTDLSMDGNDPSRSTSRAASTSDDMDDGLSGSGSGFGGVGMRGNGSGSGSGTVNGKRTKTKIDDVDRKRICEYAAAHPRQRQGDIAAVFDVERSTVSKILKNRDKWLSIDLGDAYLNRDRTIRYPELEKQLIMWCQREVQSGRLPGDEQLRDQALALAKTSGEAHIESFNPTTVWIDTFRARCKLVRPQASLQPTPPPPPQQQQQQTLEWTGDQQLSGLGIGMAIDEPVVTPRTAQRYTRAQQAAAALAAASSSSSSSSAAAVAAASSAGKPSLARSFSDTDLGVGTDHTTPTKRRRGILVANQEMRMLSPRTAARKAREAHRREMMEETPSGALKLDLRGIESNKGSVTDMSDGDAPRRPSSDAVMHLHSSSSSTTGGSGDRGGPDESHPISVDEARESLDIVLRFLREQPEDFCPRGHYLVFGHLQGSLASLPPDAAAASAAATAQAAANRAANS